MNWDWQTIVAMLAVAAAASYLVWRSVHLLRGHGAASSCASCPQKNAAGGPKTLPLVQLKPKK